MNERDIIRDFYKDLPDSASLTKAALERLDNGECAAYIIGEWYFWRHTFKLNRSCLIPRPDTEHVVEEAIKRIPKNSVFADLCTGSGCIAISILADRPDLRAVAIDISNEALDAARENARLIGVSDRITFICADLLSADPLNNDRFSAIVSNPPYIRSHVIADFPSLASEPRIALDGGDDGLVFYRRFVCDLAEHLDKCGSFIFEIGFDQGEDIASIAEGHGFSCEVKKDYGSNDRVAILSEFFQ